MAIRTTIATVTPLVIGYFAHLPYAPWAALGAYLTSIADLVDTYDRKIRMGALVTFGSAIVAFIGGVAAALPMAATVVITFLVAFSGSALRAFGRTIGTAGFFTLLAFVASLGTPASWQEASARGAYIFMGGAWATVLILSRWLVGADRPVFETVAYPYDRLTRLARLVASPLRGQPRVEREILQEHRQVRDALVAAHDGVARGRPGPLTAAMQHVIDDADHLFGVMIAFSEAVVATEGEERHRLVHVAAEVQRLTALIGAIIARRAHMGDAPSLRGAVMHLHAICTETRNSFAGNPAVERLVAALTWAVDNLATGMTSLMSVTTPLPHTGAGATTPAAPTDAQVDVGDRTSWANQIRVVLDKHATADSPIVLHAVRVAIACVVAEFIARVTQLGHGQWIALTVLVVLQPELGSTFRRGAQRILGTVVGGILAAALAATLPSPVTIFFVLVPLMIVTMMLLPGNYTLFTMMVTPTFVLFADPHTGDWRLAVTRVVNTCIGGALALIAARALWPQSERGRVRPQLAALLRAAARYTRVVADRRAPIGTPEWMTYRAATGRANTSAEDSILRWRGERVTSPPAVRNAAALVLGVRGISSIVTWLAIVGDDSAAVPTNFLQSCTEALDGLAAAIGSDSAIAPLHLPPPTGSVVEERLRRRISHIHAAATRFSRE